MKTLWPAVALLALVGCGAPKNDVGVPNSPLPAAERPVPKFSDLVVSDDESTFEEPKSTFAPDTAQIFLFFHFDNVKAGQKIKATFVAEKVEGARPDFKFKELDLDVPKEGSDAKMSVERPPANWPVGDFRVDLTLDGKAMDSVKFKVAK